MLHKTISAKSLLVVSFVLLVAITFLYANSVTVVYGALELIVAAICYLGCVLRYKRIDSRMLLLCFCTIVLTFVSGLLYGDLKSTLLITVPLLMPLFISSLNISYRGKKDFILVTLMAVAVTFLAVEYQMFGALNSNTLGFMGFMGVSLGIIWIKTAERRRIPTAILLLGFWCTMRSGSRNVTLVGLVCLVLVFLPKRLFRKPMAYWAISAFVLGYSVFAEDIIVWVFSRTKLYELLREFTGFFSEKAWEMAKRADFLQRVQEMISRRDLLENLFGTGALTTHAHNMFYQCILNFGYVGTALIYGMFYRFFKLAFILVKENRDDVAMGCVIVLWGTMLLQGADVFMVGPETFAVMPQVVMGIVLNRYAIYRRERITANL